MRIPALVVGAWLLGAPVVPTEPDADIAGPVHASPLTVVGMVSDAAGKPLEAATVQLAPSGRAATGTVTDAAGRYAATVRRPDPGGTITLTFRRIGYQPSVIAVGIDSVRTDTLRVNVALHAAPVALENVVVTGSGSGQSHGILLRGQPNAASPLGSARARVDSSARAREWNTEEYGRIEDNPFLSVAAHQLSTFSVDVDRAAYANVRRFVRGGELPPADAVRVEELVNYFPYAYAAPSGAEPVAITTDVAGAPWNPAHRIVRIGLQAPRIATDALPPSNLVFLLDVSGSMNQPNKLPLVKQAFRMLVDELRPQDRVAVVVYAGAAGLVLPSTPASDKTRILAAIGQLEAGGSTAGGAGLQLAYDVARRNFIPGGNNRVILATDGDFNVGVSSTSELVRVVETRRDEGTYLTVLGFGMGNLKDQRMEQLADKGNGNYAYIDDLLEAKKVFVHEMGATLVTVAKDVKLQVEFNPEAVQAYRLIGYEDRLLRDEDFTDDRKDAGDMGAGHSVTALYEIVPTGQPLDVAVGSTPRLRYGHAASRRSGRAPSPGSELLTVSVRFKLPSEQRSRMVRQTLRARLVEPDADFRFAMAVAGYGMLLRRSSYAGRLTLADVRAMAAGALGDDSEGYRRDFLSLVDETRKLQLAAR